MFVVDGRRKRLSKEMAKMLGSTSEEKGYQFYIINISVSHVWPICIYVFKITSKLVVRNLYFKVANQIVSEAHFPPIRKCLIEENSDQVTRKRDHIRPSVKFNIDMVMQQGKREKFVGNLKPRYLTPRITHNASQVVTQIGTVKVIRDDISQRFHHIRRNRRILQRHSHPFHECFIFFTHISIFNSYYAF